MRTYGNDIIVQRGETFAIDKLIRMPNGDPYIVSNQLKNPYIVLTVSSSEHVQNNRYVHNYWLKGFKTFFLTKPVNLKEILTSPNGSSMYLDGFDDIRSLTTESGESYLCQGYYKGELTRFAPDDAVFYDYDDAGNLVYKYWDLDEGDWKDYRFRLVKTFLPVDTRNWVPQNYLWSIQLVSGDDMMTYLQSLCDYNGLSYEQYSGESDDEKFEYLNNLVGLLRLNDVSLPTELNVKSPLGPYYETNTPILLPSKLSVLPASKGVFT